MSNNIVNLDNVNITYTTLPLNIMTGFVESVVDSCVDEITGEYTPQSYDLAIKINTVLYYSDYKLPEGLEQRYEFLLNSDLYNHIIENINKTQYREILRAIDRKIKFKLDCISYSLTTPAKQIIDKLDNVISENQKTFDMLNETNINKLIDEIGKISNPNDANVNSKIIALTQGD